MILLIDNYDSLVYNLARYVSELGYAYLVKRNDALTVDEALALRPSHIILSPGPCTPTEAGICLALIRQAEQTVPILGVCLGHQAIGQAYGGTVVQAQVPRHGKASYIHHTGSGIFQGLNNPLRVTHYHSLVVSPTLLPEALQVTAYSAEGEIMALQHGHYPIYGVQFHPEAILTEQGHTLLANFIKGC